MTTFVTAAYAAEKIRYELDKLPGRIIYGIGARERLRALTGLSPSQFAKGVAHNLANFNDIFIVNNERINGSTYMITSNADLAWLPVADNGHYIHARTKSLSKFVGVVEQELIAQDAPAAVRSAWYSIHRSLDDAVATLTPVVRQSAYMAGISEKKIERWLKV